MADIDVYVYPNRPDEDGLAQDAKAAVETGMAEIEANTNIADYNVELRTPYPEVSVPDKRGFFDNFREWRNNNGYTEVGCHLGVSSEHGGGLANAGVYTSAFRIDSNAVVGSTYGGGAFFENAAIQETCHTLIDPTLDSNSDLWVDDEHTVGTVYDDQSVSPMLTGYWNRGLGNLGPCKTGKRARSRTEITTSCTNETVANTWRDRTGGGGDDDGEDGGDDGGGGDDGDDGCSASTSASVQEQLWSSWDYDGYIYPTQFTDPCEVTAALTSSESIDLKLYVTTDGTIPSPRNYDAKSTSNGNDEAVTLSNVDASTNLLMLVTADSGGQYELSVTETSDTEAASVASESGSNTGLTKMDSD